MDIVESGGLAVLIGGGSSGAVEGAGSFAVSEAAAIESGSSASSEQGRFRMALDESSVNPRNRVSVRAPGDPGEEINDPGTGGGGSEEDQNFQAKFQEAIFIKVLTMGQQMALKNVAIAQAMMAWVRSKDPNSKDEAFTRLKKAFTRPVV